MNRNLPAALAALALTALLGGCGATAPTNYYLLSATAGALAMSQSPSLGIGPIEIPQYLNRNGLVYNRAGNQLQIANYERWAEPLANGVERVMGLNLANLLATENVRSFPWIRSDPPDYGVRIKVLLLDANDSEATLIAEWELNKPGEEKFLIRRISQLSQPMPSGSVTPEKIAPVYSELMLQLSQTIADRITADLSGDELH